MGNKSSKKTETSTAVAKHNFNTPYRTTASIKPTAQLQHNNGTEWMMVVNATAYVRCGSQNNVGAQTNVTASKVYAANRQALSEQVPRSNALTSCSKNVRSNVDAKQIPQRKDVAVGTEALDLFRDFEESTLKMSTVPAGKSTTIASPTEMTPCILKKVESASHNQGSNKISQQNFCAVNHNTIASTVQQNPGGNIHKEPPHLQGRNKPQVAKDIQLQAGDARAQDSLMWHQVNSAEKGCWYHFRRAGGGFRCTLCNVFLRGPQSVIEHAWGKFHQNKLARKRMYETDENLIWRQVPNPEKLHRNYIHKKTENQKSLFYCSICHVEVPFVYQNLLTHIRGRSHYEKIKKEQHN